MQNSSERFWEIKFFTGADLRKFIFVAVAGSVEDHC